MPLPAVLIIAIIAIAVLAVVLHKLGYTKRAKLADETQARDLFEKENPGSVVDEAALSRDGRTALLILRGEDHSLGLIQSIGDEFLTRILGAGQIARVDKKPGNTLNITFNDFTYPRARVQFRSPPGASGSASGISMYHQSIIRLIPGARDV